MGDLIEITTWPKHQNLFYLINGGGLTFEVRAPANAAIGLARKPAHSCEYWIGIGENGSRCWIKKDEEHCKTINIPDVLVQDQFVSFWLMWNGGIVRLGRTGDTRPLVSYPNRVPDLKYITFSSLKEYNPCHWKFILPPLRPKPQLKSLSDGKLIWVEAGHQLPEEAVIGGFEYDTLYVMRAPHRGSLTPGKFVPSHGFGYISWGGEANPKNEFEVLCGFNCLWVATREDKIPVGAVVGGYSEDRQERLYVGRAEHEGHVIPGKVQPSHKVCYISYKDQEISKKKYEILVEPDNVRSVNQIFLTNIQVDAGSDSEQDPWDNDDDEDMNNYDSNDEMNEVMAL